MLGLATQLICVLTLSISGTPPDTNNTLSILELSQNFQTELIQHEEHKVWKLDFAPGDSSGRVFNAPETQPWDWSAYSGIQVSLYNPNNESIQVELRMEMPPDQDSEAKRSRSIRGNIPPASHYNLRLFFTNAFAEQSAKIFWGMRGLPLRDLDAGGEEIDPKRITIWLLNLPNIKSETTLYLEEAHLIGEGIKPETLVPKPFIDRFGQFKHGDWPGKIQSENDLKNVRDQEGQKILESPVLPERDAFGGWAEGPQLEATGWFRTEKVEGKWWLVTPSGHLFFSNGMDCVGLKEQTFVEGRDTWFEWLPTPGLPPFDSFYGQADQVHSMAEAIGGKGKTFDFYRANLLRKYGENWEIDSSARTYARLRSWGFNTLGNWSEAQVLKNSSIPFVASGNINGVPEIAGATGYWAKMKDVYAEEFAPQVEKVVQGLLQEYGDNTLCIGYFIDNELAWEGVTTGILKSLNDQPARRALLAFLQERYGSLDSLNAAWETQWSSWEELGDPRKRNKAIIKDQDEFLYRFALRYFRTIQGAFKAHGSRQLYLGCRFASTPEPVVRACTEVADLSSFNLYRTTLDCDYWQEHYPWDAPMLIGEFHFGALDRGMFHTGLVPTESQQDRAEHYKNYVRSVADCPNFVGCHWFQYVDESTTGRHFDGENYNIGFVNVCDTPYPELLDAARQVHTELYTRRYRGVPDP